jgi:hypothetical protein
MYPHYSHWTSYLQHYRAFLQEGERERLYRSAYPKEDSHQRLFQRVFDWIKMLIYRQFKPQPNCTQGAELCCIPGN